MIKMMITTTKAIKDSLIKWRYASKTGCDEHNLFEYLREHHRSIFLDYLYACGICQRYYDVSYPGVISSREGCEKCPLGKKVGVCFNAESLYRKWLNERDPATRKKLATKMCDAIKSLNKKSRK